MGANVRVIGAIIAGMTLAGCAATAKDMRSKAERSAAGAINPACLVTGSRVPVHGTNCSAIGRSYTSDDIARTGTTSVGDALRLMDPSIIVHQ
jgi:hypothetical protein